MIITFVGFFTHTLKKCTVQEEKFPVTIRSGSVARRDLIHALKGYRGTRDLVTGSDAVKCTTRKVGIETKLRYVHRLVDEGFDITVTEEHKPVARRHSDNTDSLSCTKGTATHRHTLAPKLKARAILGLPNVPAGTTGLLSTIKDRGFGRLVVSMLASGTQDRGFEPGRNRRIFRSKKSSACLPSEGK
jgi:hypothetical protein